MTAKKGPEDKRLNLRERVHQWVIEHGPCTIAQVIAAVGRYLPPQQVLTAGRHRRESDRKRQRKGTYRGSPDREWTQEQLQTAGRRELVANALIRLYGQKRLSRPSRGVYGQPAPKLFVPAESA